MRLAAMFALATLMFLPFAPAHFAAELAGVQMDDSVQVGDQSLVLNGLGLRKKAIFKVYVGGLYLTAKESDTQRILSADSPRRMVMGIRPQCGQRIHYWCLGGLPLSIAGAAGAAGSEVHQGFERLEEWMDDVSTGDRLVFTYVPQEGTSVEVKGKAQGVVAGKAFADVLFSCWIGEKPPSEDFKAGLLGG